MTDCTGLHGTSDKGKPWPGILEVEQVHLKDFTPGLLDSLLDWLPTIDRETSLLYYLPMARGEEYLWVGWKVHLMTSYLLLMSSFLTMGSKHCNTNGRSVWTSRGTMLKNKPHLVTFILAH